MLNDAVADTSTPEYFNSVSRCNLTTNRTLTRPLDLVRSGFLPMWRTNANARGPICSHISKKDVSRGLW